MLPPERNLLGVQALRGIAAILVVLHHQTQVIADKIPNSLNLTILDNGAFGVDLFFPISGFVIYLSASKLTGKPGAANDFLWRRFLRVAPMYWAFTILKLVIFFAAPGLFAHYRFMPWNTIASFLFLPTYNHEYALQPVLAVGWTLAYEMLFYAIVATALSARSNIFFFCCALITILSTIGIFIPRDLGALTYLADPIEMEFLGGMAIGVLYLRGWRLSPRISLILLPLMLVVALGHSGGAANLEFKAIRAIYWGIPGVVMLACTVGIEAYVRALSTRVAQIIGDASYSLYLTHTFVLPAAGLVAVRLHMTGTSGCVTYILGSGAIALAVAIVFHRLVEAPVLTALNRWKFRSHAHPKQAENAVHNYVSAPAVISGTSDPT